MNILFIKHGALGDLIISFGALKAVRHHFKTDKIFMLTQENYKNMFSNLPYIDEFLIDNRKNIFVSIFKYIFNLKKNKINLVIDLQNSSRTNLYHLFSRIFLNVKISSSSKFAHYHYSAIVQGVQHISKNHIDQLKSIGIKNFYKPDLNWMIGNFIYSNKYIIIIPGCSKNNEYKKWQSYKFAELSKFFIKKNYEVFLTGSNLDQEIIDEIISLCPEAQNRVKDSKIKNFFSLCKFSKLIISIDTGPGHMAGLTNQPMIWLANDNKISKSGYPLGSNVHKVLSKDIKNITVDEVIKKVQKLINI